MSQATSEQHRSIQPDSHVWVMASAGSGKTHVLSQRVLRLLLEGERPESILCLTFTKAAAAEMSTRVFKHLAAMVHADDDTLIAQLADMGVAASQAAHARTLFARTLDARGGLKIQTIHAFCQSLLARYPLEAELPPGFGTLDDQKAALWLRESLEAEMRDTSQQADWTRLADLRQDGALIDDISAYVRALEESDAAHIPSRSGLLPRLRKALGLPREGTATGWFDARVTANAIDDDLLAQIVKAWSQTPTKTLQGRLDKIHVWRAEPTVDHFDGLFEAFHTAKGELLAEKSVSEGKSATHDPDIYEKYMRFCAQLQPLRDGLILFALADDTAVLARICWGMARQIRRQKDAQGLIDFADLVRKAGVLMQDPYAQWVLYKMDDQIRHILVDESQDTNHLQWRIIDAIAAEFFVGASAAKAGRTIFAVGDDKQSIYGFQGSEPELFDKKRLEYQIKSEQAQMSFNEVPLSLSFRSSPTVIGFVNASIDTLGTPMLGLAQTPQTHKAYRNDAIGSVTLWQALDADVAELLIADVEEDLTAPWRPAAEQLLAFKIAEQINAWLSGHEALVVHDKSCGARTVQAGDILILVQKRSDLMTTLVSALKSKGIAVAGVDRIQLLDQLVIKDVLAVVQFVLLPQDDLNLAALLKSPFIQLDEAQLLNLCAQRDGAALWTQLKSSDDAVCKTAHDWLDAQLARADQMPPFDFLSQLLDAPTGRSALLAALGDEVADPLNMLIDAALRYEQEEVASLQGFLHWLSQQSSDIKRDADQTRGQVRLMTIHGAKGLEAPVVILADACSKPRGQRSIITVDDMPIWYRKGDKAVGPVAAALEIQKQRDLAEYWRLYYVGITRAADHLFITGWRSQKAGADTKCYDVALQSLVAMGAVTGTDARWQQIWRIGDISVAPDAQRNLQPASMRIITNISPALKEAVPGRSLSPSRMGALALRADTLAQQRGIAIHKLLEILPDVPVNERSAVATHLLRPFQFEAALQTSISLAVLALLDDADFARLFTGAALAEAPISAMLPDGTLLRGQIDRLLIGETEIMIVDYKSGPQVPAGVADVPIVYVRQMAAYRWALQRIWNRPVRAALLWTETPRLMVLPDDLLAVHLPEPLRS
jgi:ATP-dependent helicase/nuclease subunit A